MTPTVSKMTLHMKAYNAIRSVFVRLPCSWFEVLVYVFWMCHKLEFLLPNEIGDVLLLFPCVEPRVSLCLVVCRCEEFTRGEKRRDFFSHINTVITMFLSKICHQSSDCSYVEFLFTHVATKENHLCISEVLSVFLCLHVRFSSRAQQGVRLKQQSLFKCTGWFQCMSYDDTKEWTMITQE